MRSLYVFVLLACATLLHAQGEWPRPNWEKAESVDCRDPASNASTPIQKSIGEYKVRLIPSPDSPAGVRGCRADLIAPNGKSTTLLKDAAVSIHQGTGEDIFSDGHPSLILEGFSGGAHCCYTYRIVDLSNPPLILPPIENASPFYFFKDKASGQFRIMTTDGAFDYFDGLCHACAVTPRVVLSVDRNGVHDASPRFVEQYDTEIAETRARIPPGDISKFQMSDFNDAKPVVLEIVYCYLYSGRAGDAWKTLNEMWPVGDRDRIKVLIEKTRAQGILSEIKKTRPTQTVPRK